MTIHLLVLLPLLAVTTAAPVGGTPVWVTIVAALITAMGGTFAWNLYSRWRHGAHQDAIEISQAAIEQAQGAKDLFIQYRVELEDAQKQISEYLTQLVNVNRMLGESNARIAHLERDLHNCTQGTAEIRGRLSRALEERKHADEQREQLLIKLTELQTRLVELERHDARVN